ncbi:hypothetical protein TNCV_4911831 [Trichonephila clavipes]|nr:hypothetical protein TNCV_4911831 [Trichonephila clavipes]
MAPKSHVSKNDAMDENEEKSVLAGDQKPRTALFPCCPSKRKNPVVASLSLNFLSHAILTTGAKSIKPKIGTRGEESMSRVELDVSQQGQGRK